MRKERAREREGKGKMKKRDEDMGDMKFGETKGERCVRLTMAEKYSSFDSWLVDTKTGLLPKDAVDSDGPARHCSSNSG
jgi:hypothetical protein